MEVAPLKTTDYECCLSLVGLYIGIKANKRRICIINLWKVPKWVNAWDDPDALAARNLSSKRHDVPLNPFVKQDKAKFAFCQRFHHKVKAGLAGNVQIEAVHEKKRVSRGKSHPLVAIEKGVIID